MSTAWQIHFDGTIEGRMIRGMGFIILPSIVLPLFTIEPPIPK